MTKQEINELYEESVYQIRLRLAISLMGVHGVTPKQALHEADAFIRILQSESLTELLNKYG